LVERTKQNAFDGDALGFDRVNSNGMDNSSQI